MNRRSFVTGLAALPIAGALPAPAPDLWTIERRLIEWINRTSVERFRLREADALPAMIATSDRHCQEAVRRYADFRIQARKLAA